MTEKEAWKVHNFIDCWKEGYFGIVPLQEALDKHFDSFDIEQFKNMGGRLYRL